MEQQVRLYIQAIHHIVDQELIEGGVLDQTVETMENWYDATLQVKENVTYIKYHESEPDNGEVKTVIKLEGDEVTIIRFGQVKSKQKFCKGKQYKSHYETPYGVLPLEVDTVDMVVDFVSKDDGFIQIDYALDIGGERLGTRKVDIRIVPGNLRHVTYKH